MKIIYILFCILLQIRELISFCQKKPNLVLNFFPIRSYQDPCYDGNDVSNDGCNSLCTVENYFYCYYNNNDQRGKFIFKEDLCANL